LQIKWFAYAAVLGFLAILFGSVLVPASFDDRFGTLVWTVAPLGLPISAGIAILRYRLYDIDVLINRTLVYGALTATLALVYFGGIISLQRVASILTCPQDDATSADRTSPSSRPRMLHDAMWVTFTETRCQ
jgi:hypothetical protein